MEAYSTWTRKKKFLVAFFFSIACTGKVVLKGEYVDNYY